ncbi:hypothetical protein HID58_052522, partial [Brassica napus]
PLLVNLLYQAFIVARLPPFLELEKHQEAWFKIDNSDLKNKGSKPTVRVFNAGHALHVWLNGEYHVFHTRDIDITKRLDFSSVIAVLGFSLIVSILRTGADTCG